MLRLLDLRTPKSQNLSNAIEQLRKTVRNVGLGICALLLMNIFYENKLNFSNSRALSSLFEKAVISGALIFGVVLLFWLFKMIFAIAVSDQMPEDYHSDSETDTK